MHSIDEDMLLYDFIGFSISARNNYYASILISAGHLASCHTPIFAFGHGHLSYSSCFGTIINAARA